MTVVEVRSYSLISGSTSNEMLSGRSGRLARDDLLEHQLVRRIGEGVEQADRDRLDLLGQQRIDGALGVGRIERALDLAAMVDALVDHLAQVALDQRRRLGPGEVVEPRHPQRADFQHVAEALGGDQPDARALVLEDRVGGDRRAVADLLDRAAARARSRANTSLRPSTIAWA